MVTEKRERPLSIAHRGWEATEPRSCRLHSHRYGPFRSTVLFATVWLLLLSIVLPASVGAANGIDAATVWNEVQIPARLPSHIPLVGFGDPEGEAAPAVWLAWQQEGGVFFPVWKLQIHITSNGGGSGSEVLDLQITNPPRSGDTFHAALSYDRASGSLSVLLRNAATDERVYAGNLRIDRDLDPLPPSAELFGGNPGAQDGALVGFHEGFVPVGGTWGLYSGALGSHLLARSIDRAEEHWLVTHPGEGLPDWGGYRLSLETPGGLIPLLEVASAVHGGAYPVALRSVPPGDQVFVMEYVVSGDVVLSERRVFRVGEVSLRFAVESEPGPSDALNASVWIAADESIPGVELELSAVWVEHDWDRERNRYVESKRLVMELQPSRLDVGTEETEVRFSVPLPTTAPRESVWTLTLDPGLSIETDIQVSGNVAAFPPTVEGVSLLNVVSYNVRAPLPDNGINSWGNRRELLIEEIRGFDPDVMGVQEPYDIQLIALDAGLPEYRRIEVPSYGGAASHNAIYYHTGRLELLDSGRFYYTATGEPGRLPTGGAARSVVWGQFRQIESGKEFYLYNTHLRAGGEIGNTTDRIEAAHMLVEYLQRHEPDTPVIVLGDFNSQPGTDVYRIMTENGKVDFGDSWVTAVYHDGPEPTYHGFTDNLRGRIDFIFHKGSLQPIQTRQVFTKQGDQYPSDHLPVQTLFWMW